MEKEIENKIREADNLIREGRASSAVTILKEAINDSLEEPYSHYLLGIARMKCGRFFLAKTALEKADQLLPNHAENLRSLGWVKIMLGEIEGGRKDLRSAISLDLVNPLAYLDLAMSYFNYLEFKEGFEWLERAKALNPNDPFVLQNYKIAKDMEKGASRYSKNQIAQLKKEKLKPEAWQDSHLYILERFHRGKTLTKDDESEIQKELEIFFSQGFMFKNKKSKKEEFFDDCPICRAMRAAQKQGRELTSEELKEAFKRAKEGGAIVGGEWFEKDKKYWSGYVTKHSFALDLEQGVFTWNEPRKIAESLKKSAEMSLNRKGTPFQSAMSMLNFYINRAGKNLEPARKRILEQAKKELRKLWSH